ncbi:hypothetical protein TRFO_34091 [Tritrichomonas foetus]|uniref:Uncharacterized protein n=1 Tax=Tritrichomonas foetus TaxID=1144522 RepID=A0A1J4JPH6_9EUKA|nr:hypothetical protein TRFO_34091 [Tritrichomonas foetus]|eukprot:OHS99421.1 hypothetical protein TRFO_34091 [Tritrichomonas foetus]
MQGVLPGDTWAIHRTGDPTGLMKVKVCLQRSRQAVIKPQANDQKTKNRSDSKNSKSKTKKKKNENEEQDENQEPETDDENSESTQTEGSHQNPSNDTITREIMWQERIFSPTEVLNCRQNKPISDNPSMSAKYADQIKAKIEDNSNYRGEEIFTRVTEDNYIDPTEIEKPFSNSPIDKPTELAEAILNGKGDEELVDIVRSSAQTMHIFASVTAGDGSQYEQLLGIIRAYPGGRIDVRPPFSNKTNPLATYYFEMPQSGSIYYTIDIIEDKIEDESPFERTLLGDIKRRRAIFDAAQSDCSLAQPPEPPGTIRMFYRGEIATCEMFEAENVAVEYNIKFPPGWTCENNAYDLKGCSQMADCRDTDGVAYINMPIDFVALCQTQIAPTLQVVLHSYTENNSRIVVGYGSVQLPMTRGCHTLTFDVWRVRGTVLEELKLQFLDSGLEIQPAVEAGMSDLLNDPSSDAGIPTNRFGLRTIGTGRVTVKFNLAQQSSLFRPKASQAQPPMSSLGSLSARDPNSRMSAMMNSRMQYV